MKIVSVVGARPQFIKAAALSRALRSIAAVREVLVHTGQHYDDNMSGVFFDELEIPRPTHALEIGSGSHGAQTGRMLESVERVLLQERPDRAIVFGDTNTTLAGALAAAKLHIPLAHVEAGLRSHNRNMPEELNRVLTDHASDLLLAPTPQACVNLRAEGLPESRIRLVGDLMYDASLYYTARGSVAMLTELGLRPRAYVLATIHRAENTDDRDRLTSILAALSRLAAELPVFLPLHPRTRTALADVDPSAYAGIRLANPVGYVQMLTLEKHARLIVTDSGGVQKEAYFFRVPSVTTRAETEWQELIDTGWSRLAPPSSAADVFAALRGAMDSPGGREETLYGSGHAGREIVTAILEAHGVEDRP